MAGRGLVAQGSFQWWRPMMHEQWISNVAIEYARTHEYARLRMQQQFQGFEVATGEWCMSSSADDRISRGSAERPIWRSHGEIVPFHQIRNPKCSRSQIHSKHVISPSSPPCVPVFSSFRFSPPICSNVFDSRPHFYSVLNHTSHDSASKQSRRHQAFQLKDQWPALVYFTIKSNKADWLGLRNQITAIYLA